MFMQFSMKQRMEFENTIPIDVTVVFLMNLIFKCTAITLSRTVFLNVKPSLQVNVWPHAMISSNHSWKSSEWSKRRLITIPWLVIRQRAQLISGTRIFANVVLTALVEPTFIAIWWMILWTLLHGRAQP